MKKKLICTLLAFALVLCAVPVAFPGADTLLVANAEETGNTDGSGNGGSTGTPIPAEEEEDSGSDYHIRYFVWVERGREDDGLRHDKIIMELIPVVEGDRENYLRRFEVLTGWDTEDVTLYSPADGFFTGQVEARLKDFEYEHIYGGKSTIEVGLIDEVYNAPEGTVYYEHRAFADSSINYALVLRVGELKIQIPEEYTKADFDFAAKPDGSGGWEIVLKDMDGNDIEYAIV